MIITQLKEGLGNQLFQYFFTRSFNESNYLFDISYYNYNYLRQLELVKFPKLNLKFLENSKEIISDLIYLKDDFIYKDFYIAKDKNYYFEGYWQNKKYLNKIYNLILEELEPEDNIKNYINDKYKLLKENSVSMHIRRTDFLNLSNYYYTLDKDYYDKALEHFGKENNIFIFSDDIEWCRKNINYKNIHFIEESPIIEMYMMSMCENNIIANSTFSFWSAYINKNKNKKVICPKNWFKENYSLMITNSTEKDFAKNIILEDWVRI